MTDTQATEGAPSAMRRDVLDWFVRRQGPDWNERDEAGFAAWLDADARHRQGYARWQAHWQTLDSIEPEAVARLQAGLARDKGREVERQAAASLHARQPRRRLFGLAAGGFACLAVVAGAGLLAWDSWQTQPLYQQSFSTARGQQSEVSLPDGSRLRLDTATRLDVTYLRNRRTVRLLEGQAVFAVQSDAARPFGVEAGSLVVTAIGTRYLVRHTPQAPGQDGVRIAVEEGRVRVASAADSALVLQAGQQVVADAEGRLASVQAVPDGGIAPWRENRLSFVDVPLAHALAEFERYSATRLQLADPAVAALRLSGTFDSRDAPLLRRMLPAALPVRLKDLGDGSYSVTLAR